MGMKIFDQNFQPQLWESFWSLESFNPKNYSDEFSTLQARPQPMLVAQYMQYGSLFDLLHANCYKGILVDEIQMVKFALDIASGMAYLHSLTPVIKR